MDTILFILLSIMLFTAAMICGAVLSGGLTAIYVAMKHREPKTYHYSNPAKIYQFKMDPSITDQNPLPIEEQFNTKQQRG